MGTDHQACWQTSDALTRTFSDMCSGVCVDTWNILNLRTYDQLAATESMTLIPTGWLNYVHWQVCIWTDRHVSPCMSGRLTIRSFLCGICADTNRRASVLPVVWHSYRHMYILTSMPLSRLFSCRAWSMTCAKYAWHTVPRDTCLKYDKGQRSLVRSAAPGHAYTWRRRWQREEERQPNEFQNCSSSDPRLLAIDVTKKTVTNMLPFYVTYIPTVYLKFYLAFSLALSLAFFLAFYPALLWHSIWHYTIPTFLSDTLSGVLSGISLCQRGAAGEEAGDDLVGKNKMK